MKGIVWIVVKLKKQNKQKKKQVSTNGYNSYFWGEATTTKPINAILSRLRPAVDIRQMIKHNTRVSVTL